MTTCTDCSREWTGLAECHCTGCHEHFSGLTAFDAHWQGAGDSRRCAPPGPLRRQDGNPVLEAQQRTHGWTWTGWASPEKRAKFAALNAERTSG